MTTLQVSYVNVQQVEKKLPSNEELITWLRNWDSDNVVRSAERIKKTGEIFTPTTLVQKMLIELPTTSFSKVSETFCDPCCGNGQFLSEVLIKKLENGISLENALSTIYGVEIMLDNVEVCRNRLLCEQEQYRHIVERNIAWGDGLTFNYDSWDD